jgi:hypothetical protein
VTAAASSCASWWIPALLGLAAGLAAAVVALVVADRLVMRGLSAGELYRAARPPEPCRAVSSEPGASGHRCGLELGHDGPHVCPDCGGDYEWDEGER